MPSRPTVMRSVQGKKPVITDKIARDLKYTSFVAITHDSWTSLNTESFYTTTVHFIDNTWTLKSAVLGTIKIKGTYTGENIANKLKATQLRWSLIATTDNAANE